MAELIAGAGRYARTVAHLRPAQVVHRVRLRAQRAALARVPDAVLARGLRREAPGWPATFQSVDGRVAPGFPDAASNAAGRFEFFGIERDVRRSGWSPDDTPRLWRYHLHYLECAWSFVAHEDRGWAGPAFRSLVARWRTANPGWRGDAWSPYVASLRAWALCDAHRPLVADTDDERWYVELLDLHRRHLRTHLELDVGGNHLLKNLKALIGLAVFFGDDRLLDGATQRLAHQLHVQVLGDGGHYELSPSYHCQVLGDLLDIRGLLRAAGHSPSPTTDEVIDRMRRWLGWMLLPDGDVPLFNDCVLVGADRIAVLDPVSPPSVATAEVHLLAASGFAVLRHPNGIHAVLDVGDPCPPDLPAHGHADCLSIQVSFGDQRVVLDTGTSTYEEGARRDHERSTAAHSTSEVDGEDQSEMWGAFRAGRLARATVFHVDATSISAMHDGYRHLAGSPTPMRTAAWRGGTLEIRDEVRGAGSLAVRFILRADVVVTEAGVTAGSPLVISSDEVRPSTVERGRAARGFGDEFDVMVWTRRTGLEGDAIRTFIDVGPAVDHQAVPS